MLLSAVSLLVVAQSSSEIPEGLMNNPVLRCSIGQNAKDSERPGQKLRKTNFVPSLLLSFMTSPYH